MECLRGTCRSHWGGDLWEYNTRPVDDPQIAPNAGRTAWADDSLVESWWLDTGSVRRTLIRCCLLVSGWGSDFVG